MGEKPLGRGRRVVPQDVETAVLRRRLLRLYAEDKRYQTDVLVDLRPLWSKVPASYKLDAEFHITGWVASVGRDGSESLGDHPLSVPEIQKYAKALGAYVTDSMRLSWNNQPAGWAVEHVHGDVTEAGVMRDDLPSDEILPEHVSVEISARFDSVQIRLFAHGEELQNRLVTPQDPIGVGLGPDDWSVIQQIAVDLVREAVTATREQLETWTPKGRNLASLHRQQKDLLILFRLLFHQRRDFSPRIPEGKAVAQRLRSLCTTIRITFPPILR